MRSLTRASNGLPMPLAITYMALSTPAKLYWPVRADTINTRPIG